MGSLFGLDFLDKAKSFLVDAIGGEQEKDLPAMQPPGFSPEAGKADKNATGGGNENSFASMFGLNKPQSLSKCLAPELMSDADLQKEAKLLDEWLKNNPSEATNKPFLVKALADIQEEMNIRASYDDVTEKPHKMAGLNGSNGEMVRTMLEAAGYDPEKWYKEMVSINLFGQEARGIRPEFAALLKQAEKKTCEKLSKENPTLSNPRLAGQFMGINESYKTSRALRPENPAYQSMHLFGLAIDVNYTNNPWITQKTEKIKPFKGFLKNIDALFNTNIESGYTYTGAQTEVESTTRLEEIFDGYQTIDDKVELYFSLLENDELLEKFIKESKSPTWNSLKLASAKKKIRKDLDAMATQSSRGGGQKKNFQKQGIMDLDKRLVMSMGEVGLDWGGKYGDMMHFDMRFTGIGKEINAAKGKSSVVKLKKKLTK